MSKVSKLGDKAISPGGVQSKRPIGCMSPLVVENDVGGDCKEVCLEVS